MQIRNSRRRRTGRVECLRTTMHGACPKELPYTGRTAGPKQGKVRFMGLLKAYTADVRISKWVVNAREDGHMRGYFTASGYYGLVNGHYCLFASESEYYESVQSEDEGAA